MQAPSRESHFGRLEWYWHRFRSMGTAELAGHVRKKATQLTGSFFRPAFDAILPSAETQFPPLPKPAHAPEVVVQSLKRDAERISKGQWRFFGHHQLQVDMPPRWHKDYLALVDVPSAQPGFRLNHRELPGGADIKLVWELSRWYSLTRLALASWVLREPRFADKCLALLEDWVDKNPPFRGWNWTSALESGFRLIQFTWIDALVANGEDFPNRSVRLQTVRQKILGPHVFYTWRNRSFGSSANNHLIGELAGLIVALVRWPGLDRWCPDLRALAKLWEAEVLAQFDADGGNREQALNYHLFSWELSHQARLALQAAHIPVNPEVGERLEQAVSFFVDVQTEHEAWDYGDSDSAYVLPLLSDERQAVFEWRAWMAGEKSESLSYWLGSRKQKTPSQGWTHLSHSGYSVFRSEDWFLRWDLSPLGFLRTAAHGHLDALHLSIWHQGVAMVVDPGTGAYYGDAALRNHLASRRAHNGPNPEREMLPQRQGPFLWSEQHGKAELTETGEGFRAELVLKSGRLLRCLKTLPGSRGWVVEDTVEGSAFSVLWQFAPESHLERLSERRFRIERAGVSLFIEVSDAWEKVALGSKLAEPGEGTVSRFFRQKEWAPFLKLTAGQSGPCLFRTTFLASASA